MRNSKELYEDIRKYLYNEYLEQNLNKRYINLEDEGYLMPAKDMKRIMKLDEYFYRLMKERESLDTNPPLKRYLYEISRELYAQPLLLLDLPMYQLDKNILRRYLVNYDYVISKINEIENEANNIYLRFIKSPSNITYKELQKLTKFFSYNIPYNDSKMYKAQEQVAKFILNHQKDTAYNYTFTVFLIKFFGYKKIREDKLNDTRIVIGKLNPTTYGESTENFAIINKELIQKVTMENNKLYDKFGKTVKVDRTNPLGSHSEKRELLGILHTLYHEIRHQKQKAHSEAANIDDLSYYYAAYEIINENNEFDYKANYKCYEIEKDANYCAWEDIEKLIKTYMPNHNLERLMSNILAHKLKEELDQITGIRKSQDNHTYISSSLLIKYIDEKVMNKPSLATKEYKQLQTFYNNDGTPKKFAELLKLPLVYEFREFYFIQLNYRSKIYGTKLSRNDIQTFSQKEMQTAINNIKILMIIIREKLNKIRNRIDRYNKSIEDISTNVQNYYNFSIYLSNIMNDILLLYPDIIKIISIKNSIDTINSNIDMINNNSLVRKFINNPSKISRVGRR